MFKVKNRDKVDLIDHIIKHDKLNDRMEYDPENTPILMDAKLIKSAFCIDDFNEQIVFSILNKIRSGKKHLGSSFFRIYTDGKLSPKDEDDFFGSHNVNNESLEEFFFVY